MTHDDQLGDPAELAALYAAGAMSVEERQVFETHLARGCTVCAAAVKHLDPVVAALALAAGPVRPDPATRARLMQRLTGAPIPVAADEVPTAPDDLFIQRGADAPWRKTAVPGMTVRLLFVDRALGRYSALVRMGPGCAYPPHGHDGPEECLVLEGDLWVAGQVLHAGDYQRARAGSTHDVQTTDAGCLVLITAPCRLLVGAAEA